MKREGRQHGVVRCYENLPFYRRQRLVKMVDSASVAGLFTKVSRKPTNQSKFTGKCGRARCAGCHIHPASKSKDKAKGTMKLRSIEAEKELAKYSSGTSATRLLAYLADEHGYNDDDYDYGGTVDKNYNYDYPYVYDNDDNDHHDHDLDDGTPYAYDYDDNDHHDHDDGTHDFDLRVGFGIGIGIAASVAAEDSQHGNDVDDGEIDDDDDNDDEEEDDDDDDSFCDVGLCWGHGDGDEYGDDGWYLVGGQMQ